MFRIQSKLLSVQRMRKTSNCVEKAISRHQHDNDIDMGIVWQKSNSSSYVNVPTSNHKHTWNKWKTECLSKEIENIKMNQTEISEQQQKKSVTKI